MEPPCFELAFLRRPKSIQGIMNWYYIDGPLRVGPLNETEWAELVGSGKIQPETLVWHEGVEKWTPYRLMTPPVAAETEPPDLDEVIEAQPAENPQAFAACVVDLDYPVNLGRCISRAWAAFTSDFWMLVGAAFLIAAISLAAAASPLLQTAMSMAFRGVLLGGLYSVYLRILRGEHALISDLFAGFRRPLFKPLALTTLVAFLVGVVCFLPATIATDLMGILPADFQTLIAGADPQSQIQALTLLWGALTADPQKTLVWLLVLLTCSLPVVYFAFCWMFSIPLIVDKGMDFWPAMQLSRRKVLQHPWRIALLALVAEILGFSGALGFGIGVVFTLPLSFLIKLALYEDIFNGLPSSRSSAPVSERD